MKWTDIRKMLENAPNDVLIEIIKGLYKLSPQNKAFIRVRLLPGYQDRELLEKSRKQVIRAVYPEKRACPSRPRFGESRRVIRAYQKATGDPFGTLDLMLLHVERGTKFTRDFGDIDEPFYIALETMLGNAIELLFKSPDAGALYEQFQDRFKKIERAASRIGWGYGDAVSDMICELQEKMMVKCRDGGV
ncbi:MAG: hypothetical protein GXP40_09785 [Chloroflexi bacterium]|nr:hypothetical protein [Chloroflexota bacterium]